MPAPEAEDVAKPFSIKTLCYTLIEKWVAGGNMKPKIDIVRGDITTFVVDVIVNAANPSLMGGGGVDDAIHRAAGPQLLDACKKVRQQQGECAPGHAVITIAGDLPAKAVIHTVGPVWHGGEKDEARTLEDAYRNCLRLAADNGYKTMAFPAISTGVYGYPKAAAAAIAVDTVYRYLSLKPMPEEVTFVCFDEETAQLYRQRLRERETEFDV